MNKGKEIIVKFKLAEIGEGCKGCIFDDWDSDFCIFENTLWSCQDYAKSELLCSGHIITGAKIIKNKRK